jgi:hypothetical protein
VYELVAARPLQSFASPIDVAADYGTRIKKQRGYRAQSSSENFRNMNCVKIKEEMGVSFELKSAW